MALPDEAPFFLRAEATEIVPPPPTPIPFERREKISKSKRKDYLSWDTYFMGVAFLTGMRSKDPSTQVGAVIVNKDNRIVGVGYNGFPAGIQDEDLPWAKDSDNGLLDTKYPYVCHAELNAILNKNVESCRGCRLYSTLYPCCECAKVILQAGIRHVIYASDKNRDKDVFKASQRMFQLAGVQTEFWPAEFAELRIPLQYEREGQACADMVSLQPPASLLLGAPMPEMDDAASSEPSTADDTVASGSRKGESEASSLLSSPQPKMSSEASYSASRSTRVPSQLHRQVILAVGLEASEAEVIHTAFAQDEEVHSIALCDCVKFLQTSPVLPDLILLDGTDIGKSIVDVCRKIRLDLGIAKDAIPMLVICPEGTSSNVLCNYLDAGCHDYITKPLVQSLLLARVRLVMQAKRLHDLETSVGVQCRPMPTLEKVDPSTRLSGQRYENVTVLVCGVKSSQMTVQDLAFLSSVVHSLDEVARKHGVSKVHTFDKTITYVAGCNASTSHAADTVRCGAGMLHAIRALRGSSSGQGQVQLRLGAHTGSVCSGLIGDVGVQTCFFGEAVQHAQDLESAGLVDCLHISETTWRSLPGGFSSELRLATLQQKASESSDSPSAPTHILFPLEGFLHQQAPKGLGTASPQAKVLKAQNNTHLTVSPSFGSHLQAYYQNTSADCYR